MRTAYTIQDILNIGLANGNVQYDVAVDMFLNNIKDAGNPEDQYHYAGADDLDYKALQPELKAITEKLKGIQE